MPEVLEKVKFTRDLCNQLGIAEKGLSANSSSLPFDIQVDGGINLNNVGQCIAAGANVIVAGTSLFAASDLSQAIKKMRNS